MSTPTKSKSITPTVAPTPPARQSNGEAQSGNGGKRMYRMSDGSMVELPPEMSMEEAAKLEAEARAAEKKHGKGQQPRPLKPKAPVVTKAAAADKAAKKVKPKDKKSKTAKKGKTAPKGGGMAAILAAVGKSKIAQYLASLGGPVLMRGMQKLAQLKANEQTHDTPAAKLSQTEMAVVPPAHEGQSKSHGEQVEALGAKPEPKPDPGAAKQSLQKSLDENIPQTIEDVDNFKKNQKATHISRNVMNVVQGDTNEVTDTFGEMEKPRPPAPPTHTPEALPPEETAPATPNMQLGAGAVAPLKAEHTDMSKFSKDSDELLKKEEISQEQLDMVDSGDLAEANKDKKQLKKDVQEQPAQVRHEAEKERKQVDTSLQQEEQKGKTELKNKRKAGLSATRGKQTGTKSLMEQKREKVATDIKNIYEKAKHKVNTRLAELETQSMKRFDEGNAAASKKFEDDVNKDLAAFKKERYSGFWGWAKKAKDWLLGMDELPEVNEIFKRNKDTFVQTIDKLVADITADNQKVIKECKAEIESAKAEIAKYVKNLGPELKAEGQKAMKEMTDKLNELDKQVEEKEKELAQKLKDKQTAAIKAIDQKIEKMKESMSGALAKLGKLLLEAAKKFFTWALQKFGYSLSEIEGIINKGAAVLKAIFTKPIKFVKNLFNAADQGFSNFGKNFLTHLKNALFSWLTGSLTEVKLPDTWDLKGIASVALQMVGISYQNIRKHLVKIIPEPVVEGMEKGFEIVKALITEGPMAAWEQLQEMAGEMKEAFVDAVKNWIKETIIVKAIEFIASLIIPGAGIIKAIIGIYDTIVFFIQKAKDIAQMVGNFLGSIGEIAMGNIGAAANALENGLATALTLVISFLAKLIHLDGVTAKIRAALNKIRGKVENMMAKVAKWIAEKAKKLWGGVKKKGEQVVDAVKGLLGLKETIKLENGEKHTLLFEKEGDSQKLIIRSDRMTYERFIDIYLADIQNDDTLDPKSKKEKLKALKSASKTASKIDSVLNTRSLDKDEKEAKIKPMLNDLRSDTQIIFGKMHEIPESTIPQFTPFRGMGRETTVSILNRNRSYNGSDPTTGSHSIYDILNLRRFPGKPDDYYYVRGHLLNNKMGGQGIWDNMTPLSKKGNSNHSNTVETFAKKAIEAGASIYYRVKANYQNRGDKASLINDITSQEPDTTKRATKINIVNAEDNVPTSLHCQIILLKKNGKSYEKFQTLFDDVVDNPIQRTADKYTVR
jgi:hypothetical protein